MRHQRPNNSSNGFLLAIESSCDETAAAVIDRQLRICSNVVQSQDDLHRHFGGVVPEIASRDHVRKILPTIDQALRVAGIGLGDLTAIAVTTRPGLVGSLLVGLTAAKSLAMALDVPFIGVNHVEAHLYACRLAAKREIFPAIGLVVSGGHTLIYDCHSSTDFELLGSTVDDAAGEAFDKGAKILGLGYPGGPAIQRAADAGNRGAVKFPRPMIDSERLDFSFSGLKTALLYQVNGGAPGRSAAVQQLSVDRVSDLAASYQEAIVDVLCAKCRLALMLRHRAVLCVGGGVAANTRLRARLTELAAETSCDLVLAPPELCTDNAAMAAMGWELLDSGAASTLDLDVSPSLLGKSSF